MDVRRAEKAVQRRPREAVRKARTDLYRQHIVEAAEQIFADRGFETAKLQDISQLAGLSMGSIYAIFPSKAELVKAILEERAQEMLALAREVAQRGLPGRETLRALIEAYIDYFISHPHFLRMHLRQGSSWVLSPSPDTEARVQHWNEVHGIQTEIFRRGITEGAFIEEDPAYLAKLFSAMDQVLLAHWADEGMSAGRGELVERFHRLAERVFCRPASS